MIIDRRVWKIRIVAVLVAVLFLLGSHVTTAQETFEQWFSNAGPELEQEAKEYVQRTIDEGFAIVYSDLMGRASDLKTTAGLSNSESGWIDDFVVTMESSRNPESAAVEALGETGSLTLVGGGRTAEGTSVMQSACQKVRSAVRSNPINPIEDPFDGTFVIMEGRPGEAEIRIARTETSKIARELWRIGIDWQSAITKGNADCMDTTAAAIAAASDRWDLFMANAVADQFPWETLLNGWLGERFDSLAGTLAYPPEWQLRILHPEPVMVVSTEGSTEFKARIAVEALGYRKLSKGNDYRARNGISIVLTLPASSAEKIGYGLLYTRKAATFGIMTQKIEGQGDVISLVFGLTLAERLENTSNKLKERRQMIEDQFGNLKEVLEECREDPVACATDQ